MTRISAPRTRASRAGQTPDVAYSGCARLLHLSRRASVRSGFNRSTACYQPGINNVPIRYCSPSSFTSDALTNNELGWKTQWFGHRLQWNGAIYQEDWKNVQVNLFDPGVLGNVRLRHERADLPGVRGVRDIVDRGDRFRA